MPLRMIVVLRVVWSLIVSWVCNTAAWQKCNISVSVNEAAVCPAWLVMRGLSCLSVYLAAQISSVCLPRCGQVQ